ncbi:MAG TPA: hypothetical protein VNZ05_08485 [Solirubrobacteraceae bacterium]|jgi:hypothetical protein|nr:hypothetical protein [Solirubrobacteraceae bacterium]
MGRSRLHLTLVGSAISVALLLAFGAALALGRSAAPRARAAIVQDVTGLWLNQADQVGPPWQLTTSNNRATLDATWSGSRSHANLRGSFHGNLIFLNNVYEGEFHINEEGNKVDGKMKVKVNSSTEILITLSPENGGRQEYTFIRSSGAQRPELEFASTPSGFGQTVSSPAPPPGGESVTTSPELTNAGSVVANVGGLSPNDVAFTATPPVRVKDHYERRCFLVATTVLVEFVHSLALEKKIPTLEVDREIFEQELAGRVLNYAATCMAAAEQKIAAEAGMARSAAAVASSGGCAVTPVTLTSRRVHGRTRLQSLRVGGTKDLSVTCSSSSGALKLRVASRSGKPLRKSLGSTMFLGVARSGKDSPGGQLSFSYRRH